MINRKEVKRIIDERVMLHPDDPLVAAKREILTDILTRNPKDTIEYLKGCNIYEAFWLAEIFEKTALQLNSKLFEQTVADLAYKYPCIHTRAGFSTKG